MTKGCATLLILGLLLLWHASGGASGAYGGDFADWIGGVRAEAMALGVWELAAGALDRVRPNPQVLSLDRFQKVLGQDWQTFAGRMVNACRLKLGA